MADDLTDNARDLEGEVEWLVRFLDARFEAADGKGTAPDVSALPPPDVSARETPWARFVRESAIAPEARLVLVLALIPHLLPHRLDALWTRSKALDRVYTEFGGTPSPAPHGPFVPTGETALFVLAGDDLARRLTVTQSFERDPVLKRAEILRLGAPANDADAPMSGALRLTREFVERVTLGAARRPSFGSDFPARRIETDLAWTDLVLPGATLAQLDEVRAWATHGSALLGEWGMRARLKPGFTCLFCGPPGTGKTLAACLLAKHCARDVYKIDLSLVVSKFIGETEKNLSRVFDAAEREGWILFFDEADAIFGKRTRVDDAHDRYANQEVSYLLQRIEDFDGVVILASNFKANIDEAFLRRFHAVVQFPVPHAAERLRLWREAIPRRARVDAAALERVADRYPLTGGTIMNVVRYALLQTLTRGDEEVREDDLDAGARRELMKEGRTG